MQSPSQANFHDFCHAFLRITRRNAHVGCLSYFEFMKRKKALSDHASKTNKIMLALIVSGVILGVFLNIGWTHLQQYVNVTMFLLSNLLSKGIIESVGSDTSIYVLFAAQMTAIYIVYLAFRQLILKPAQQKWERNILLFGTEGTGKSTLTRNLKFLSDAAANTFPTFPTASSAQTRITAKITPHPLVDQPFQDGAIHAVPEKADRDANSCFHVVNVIDIPGFTPSEQNDRVVKRMLHGYFDINYTVEENYNLSVWRSLKYHCLELLNRPQHKIHLIVIVLSCSKPETWNLMSTFVGYCIKENVKFIVVLTSYTGNPVKINDGKIITTEMALKDELVRILAGGHGRSMGKSQLFFVNSITDPGAFKIPDHWQNEIQLLLENGGESQRHRRPPRRDPSVIALVKELQPLCHLFRFGIMNEN